MGLAAGGKQAAAVGPTVGVAAEDTDYAAEDTDWAAGDTDWAFGPTAGTACCMADFAGGSFDSHFCTGGTGSSPEKRRNSDYRRCCYYSEGPTWTGAIDVPVFHYESMTYLKRCRQERVGSKG